MTKSLVQPAIDVEVEPVTGLLHVTSAGR